MYVHVVLLWPIYMQLITWHWYNVHIPEQNVIILNDIWKACKSLNNFLKRPRPPSMKLCHIQKIKLLNPLLNWMSLLFIKIYAQKKNFDLVCTLHETDVCTNYITYIAWQLSLQINLEGSLILIKIIQLIVYVIDNKCFFKT